MNKKAFMTLVCTIALFVIGACSGTPSYDAAVCEQLKEKIESEEALTDQDYGTMIGQVEAAAREMKRLQDETEGDKEKEKALLDDPEFRAMMEYTIGFSLQLQKDAKKLSPDNVKKMAELGETMKSLKQDQ